MRPLIDLNNVWHSEQTLVYNSRFSIVTRIIGLILLFVLGIYLLVHKQYVISLIIPVPFYILFQTVRKLIAERDVVQLRINIEGIKVRNQPMISWDHIQNERIETIKNGDAPDEHDFVFYDSQNNKHFTFRVEKLNIGPYDLLKSTEIHRGRFNRRNNPD